MTERADWQQQEENLHELWTIEQDIDEDCYEEDEEDEPQS